MHTNSAAESIVRLLDLGLDPFNFADALKGIVGQRLARRLCTACCQPYQPAAEELDMLAHEYCFETDLKPSDVIAQWKKAHRNEEGKLVLQRANGCDECNGSGYKGRVGVHELLMNTAAVKRKIHAKATVQEIVKIAVSEGMQTLRQDGINKIFQGYTDWEQVRTI
jgi:type II secretory ATPase GspE/PulE/Tfp pilus assembly ATPase PilB-like protein